MGHYTGYDPTNESGGFSWREFQNKWEFVAQELYDNSVFFMPAIAIVGLLAIFGQSRRWGLLLTSWFVPGGLLYVAYYWGGNTFGPGYLRFYVALFPPLILAALWLTITQARSTLAAGLVVAIASAIGLRTALPAMERDQASNLNLAYTVNRIVGNLPPSGSVVIADQGSNFYMLDNALQFAGDFDLYATDAFHPPVAGNLRADQPSPDQPGRRQFLLNIFKDKSDADLVNQAHRVISDALKRGQPVYVVLQPAFADSFKRKYLQDAFQAKLIDRWTEPATVPPEEKGGPLSPEAHGFVFRWIQSAQSFELWRIQR
jgi:hypothetical protein